MRLFKVAEREERILLRCALGVMYKGFDCLKRGERLVVYVQNQNAWLVSSKRVDSDNGVGDGGGKTAFLCGEMLRH